MNATTGSATVTPRGEREIVITREFDAPAHHVFRAWTEPDLIRRWWAGQRGTVVSIEADFRVGGTWRYVMAAHNGMEVAFHGECREIVPDRRIVSTEVYEAVPDAEAINTLTLTDLGDNRTRLEIVVEHQTGEARDMHLNSGMEVGLNESLDLLESLAREIV